MLNKDELIKVTNRDNGHVGYYIPDLGRRRDFAPKETKLIPYEELEKLNYLAGGKYILSNCLLVHNKETINELVGEVEPEYFYTDKELIELLTNPTKLDEFKDCIDFAPTGVVERIKELAVQNEIPDIRRRDYIKEKLGFNITKAIEINNETKEEEPASKNNGFRRIAKVDGDIETEPKKQQRRVILKP